LKNLIPVHQSKQQIKQNYDNLSSYYDWLTQSEKQIIKVGIDLISPSPGDSILEVGSGTGTALKMMAESFPHLLNLTGLDISRKMLGKSKSKTDENMPFISHVQGDCTALPMKDDLFEHLFCSFTLDLLSADEIHLALDEMRRVIKPSGQLIIISMASSPRTLAIRLYEAAHKCFPKIIDCRPIPLYNLLQDKNFHILKSIKQSNFGLPIWTILAQS
jgi:ubiquinone/menaquinone biosynthesis C-methylase UbiE